MSYLLAFLVWPIALAAIPAKTLLFSGTIHVWPFLLASCAVAAFGNWKAAAVLAFGVGASQVIERTFVNPEVFQLAVYAVLSFISFGLFDKVAAITAATVAILYVVAIYADWRIAMITSEVVIVAGLTAAILNGPSGGIFQPNPGTDSRGIEDMGDAVSDGRGIRSVFWAMLGSS